MAIEESKATGTRILPSLACTIPYLGGMVLVYLGEKVFDTPLHTRLILDGIGLAAILWALTARMVNWARASGDVRSVEGRMLFAYLGGVIALAMVALQLETVQKSYLPWFPQLSPAGRLQGVLQVLWPIVWLSSVLPLIFMETAYASMSRATHIERRRVGYSGASGLTIAWVLATLFLINYLAAEHNRKWDLSYAKAASPSEDAKRLVASLQEIFEVVLFYPDANEVREALASYYQDLSRRSDLLQVKIYDQALEPRLAQELGSQRNGTVVYRYQGKKEAIPIGLEADQAQPKLSKLDTEFQEKFLKLVSEQRLAYFVTGHGERRYDWSAEDHRATLKGLKAILRGQNFDVKPLGIAQGLASEVPGDASLVLIVDPREDFLPEEMRSLEQYLERGGKLWVILDPDSTSNISGLVEKYGVKFTGTPLANERYFMRATYNKADEYNLFSNRTSSHPSVNTLSRNSTQLAAVLLKTGYLEKVQAQKPEVKVVMTLRSMPDTWADESRELKGDAKEKKTFDLAAAVSMPVAAKAPEAVREAADGEPSANLGTGDRQPQQPGEAESKNAAAGVQGDEEAKEAAAAGTPGEGKGAKGKDVDQPHALTEPRAKEDAKSGTDAGANPVLKKNDKGRTDGNEMRMLVLADADALSDTVLGNLGNYYLFDDGLKWLFPDESLAGGVGQDEDVRILHTKEKDVARFYGTIFAMPLIVLGAGVAYNRYRVRRKRRD